MADMTTIKGRIAETIYPNGKGAITAEKHQALLLEMVDDINAKKADKEEVTAVAESVSTLSQEVESNRVNLTESINALEQKVDNLPQGEEFDAEGNYPSLRVGTADTAIDLAGRGESVPASFGFRASGGKSIKDGRAYIKRIKGNSVVWNQKAQPLVLSNYTLYGHSATEDNGIHINTLVANVSKGILQAKSPLPFLSHKWLAYADVRSDAELTIKGVETTGFIANSTCRIYAFYTATNNNAWYWGISYKDNLPTSVDIYSFCIIDLTQMFQAGNEPKTIEEFNAREATLGIDLNAYNEGEVIHMTAEGIKSVGDNAWDEEWEVGSYDTKTGQPLVNNDAIRTKGRFKILGGQEYFAHAPTNNIYAHFYDAQGDLIKGVSGQYNYAEIGNKKWMSPSDATSMTFYVIGQSTYNNDIMITLVHSGWKQDTDAGYQPYWQDTLPLPIIRKYFPQGMKSAGTAHDEIRYNKATKKWEMVQRIGEVDMGSLAWKNSGSYENTFYVYDLKGAKPIGQSLCSRYVTSTKIGDEKTIMLTNNDDVAQLYATDSAYTDAASFKAAMQDVMLYYELANPIVTELDTEDQNFRDYYNVADFGTEEAIPATDAEGNIIPSANFSADIIYQFNAVDMIREHEIEINELQSIIATMQAQLASLINKE